MPERAFAVISDIHSNLEALRAVLDDIEERGVTEIVCLGDVVGYGPNPKECLDLVRERCRVCLMGNHDHALLYEPCNFNVAAERACFWTRQLLEDEEDKELRNARWQFLGNMPVRFQDQDILYVHASPRRPINEYIFPEDVFTNPQKVVANFDRLDRRLCFVGHTHQPGVFLDDPYFDPPNELPDSPFYEVEDERAIVNVGSVGQPRDRDPRASYVLVYRQNDVLGTGTESLVAAALSCAIEQIEFVRVEYDIEKTVKKILALPALDELLGTRLYDGR
ncbi:MAG: metallophosphoesterase [Phycisphaerae bacterium]|jgi:diadenosine tetraphosphatase ApaH/serine/threonine PP2A family protein phosphatase|nr:metallophosphoesterase [Phycisphaerae bacterium]